jgi:hypothetical protein
LFVFCWSFCQSVLVQGSSQGAWAANALPSWPEWTWCTQMWGRTCSWQWSSCQSLL